METARDRAIARLREVLDAPEEQLAAFVDAIIEAARAPESAHTRAVDEERTR